MTEVRSADRIEVAIQLGRFDFTVVAEVCAAEHERRKHIGLAAIKDFETIATIWSLPVNGKVARSSLGDFGREVVQNAPRGIVDITIDALERLVHPPVHVLELRSHGPTAGRALEAFGDRWWAPLEVAVSQRGVARSTIDYARRLGIGLIASGELVLPAREKSVGRPTELLWWQSELVYDEWLNAGGEQPIAESAVMA